jgi:hypothetical protein
MRKIRVTVTDDQGVVLDRAEFSVCDGVTTLDIRQESPLRHQRTEYRPCAEMEIGTGDTKYNDDQWVGYVSDETHH